MRYFLILVTIANFLYAIDYTINGFGSFTLSSKSNDVEADQYVYIDQEEKVDSGLNLSSGSLFGLQTTLDFNQFQMVGQGIFRETFDSEIYEPELEWLFAKTDLSDELSLRAGKMRIPAFLHSQTLYVDYTRNFAKLPREMYIAVPFTNYKGVELALTKNYNDFIINGLIGISEKSDYDNIAKSGDNIISGFEVNDILIASLGIENEQFMLKGTYIDTKVNIQGDQYSEILTLAQTHFPDIYNDHMPINKDMKVMTIGAEYYLDNLTLSGEWIKRTSDSALASIRGYYLSAAYRLSDKLTPYFYYSKLKQIQKTDSRLDATPSSITEAYKLALLKSSLDELEVLNGNDDSSRSICLGVKYNITDSLSAKVEVVNTKDENYENDYNTYYISLDFFF